MNVDLSVVIVEYNVSEYLENCLRSVFAAAARLSSIEVFVVDNCSADNSCDMVRNLFPSVILIENSENIGFAKANNIALKRAAGRYVLILNPDTLVPENCFIELCSFMDTRADAGAAGVRLVLGNGCYLPESKRGIPYPVTAFFKIIGLSALFPESKFFARYYLGHLDDWQINNIEILPGAFMFVRKSALDKAGLFDEDYFMYGEDIDLSFRILKSGLNIVYYPLITVIHFKGRSTVKVSRNYVNLFYSSMLIFARKHLCRYRFGLLNLVVTVAVYFRAFISLCGVFFTKIFRRA